MSRYSIRECMDAQRDLRWYLARRGHVGIVALGVGHKRVMSRDCPEPSVQLFVCTKRPQRELPRRDRLPATLGGIPTDIRASASAYFASSTNRPDATAVRKALRTRGGRSRMRPLVAGVSCAHRYVSSGTLGFFCRDADAPDDYFLLSCGHVFGGDGALKHGGEILQSAPADGGTDEDVVADFVRNTSLNPNPRAENLCDAAVARVRDHISVKPRILQLGFVSDKERPAVGMEVAKHGRSTGLTRGRIVSVAYETIVEWGVRTARPSYRFTQQLRIEPVVEGSAFARFGDSGALIVTASTHRALGLYFAGPADGSYGIASPIDRVESSLGVRLAYSKD